MLPTIPFILTCGIIKGLNIVLNMIGLYSTDSGVYTLLSAMGAADDSVFFVGRLYILLLFSFVAALASLIFSVRKLHTAINVVIHYIICFLDMYLCVFVIFFKTSGMEQHVDGYTPSQILVASVMFTLVYAVVIAVCLIIGKATKKKHNATYTKQFKELSE